VNRYGDDLLRDRVDELPMAALAGSPLDEPGRPETFRFLSPARRSASTNRINNG